MKNLHTVFTLGLFMSIGHSALAADSVGNASTALKHSGQAVKHGAIASGQLASGVVAVPLVIAGEVGELSGKAGKALLDIATDAPPLEVSETALTAAPSPAEVMGTRTADEQLR
ncbi:hypothetical protein [Cellvibrio japonicus]|uniref:Uncharacterized protein n=1 Tax=Cellvibrio japonicus (strain Ueda107) TaxID=498211 RepID=B3PLA8_CELJU|nr:hypothetical protein [Cellvibrio japonicus]ACE85962.1 hypothetical protein CJA_0932 [Cellvibrio japonicus Ueda107]QEI11565.1 hypothetical protein FY117_04540 [Cellvibrio japonicus]QEI15139.1 hypothetical protein FY116_04540 [Cellvibrio japonicus]QEI18719.1 hypothetical protein FY115_04540 [Cellvibrio japonicus]